MANTLTAVAPVLYSAARIVPRELTGFLSAAQLNFDDKGVAKGDAVTVGIAPVLTASAVTPSQTFSAGQDRSFSSATLNLNQFYEVPWNLTAEQEKSLANSGVAQDLLAQTVQQAIRTMVNKIESYVGVVADQGASRAYGTAGTAPFGSTIADLANARKIVVDNGAPKTDLHLVMDTTAGLGMRSLSTLFKVNEGGNDKLLRDGDLGRIYGIDLHESGNVAAHVKGTGTSYTSDTAGYAVGATAITLITGSGTVVAGDVVTFAGDTNKYIVKTGVAAPGVITLQEPGLKVALAASAVAMTIGANHTSNILMHRNAVCAVVRPAIQPEGAVAEQMVITDDQTKLSFLLLRVPGNAMSSWYLRCVYDAFTPNGYAAAKLLG